MSFGDGNKGGQKRGGLRGQDNDENDSYGGENGKKKREISYRPKDDDNEDDDGNQDFERSSRTKNAKNAAEDDA